MAMHIEDANLPERCCPHTLGAVAKKIFNIRFDARKAQDVKATTGWWAIFASIWMVASDEERMVREEQIREPKDEAWTKRFVEERRKDCSIVKDLGNLGEALMFARDLYRHHGPKENEQALERIELALARVTGHIFDTREMIRKRNAEATAAK